MSPLKRCAGLEDDMVWIECAPEEMEPCHLEELEKAVSQTNANYRHFVQQRAVAEQRQRERNARVQAQLDELADHFDSSADSAVASDKSQEINDTVATRPNPFICVIGLLRVLIGVRGKDGDEMVSHGA